MSVALKSVDGSPLTLSDVRGSTDKFLRIVGSLVPSGTYTAQGSGGDTIDWTTVGDLIQGTLLSAQAYSVKPTANRYVFKKGTTLASWQLAIFGADGTEPANASAYPTDTVIFEAVVRKFI